MLLESTPKERKKKQDWAKGGADLGFGLCGSVNRHYWAVCSWDSSSELSLFGVWEPELHTPVDQTVDAGHFKKSGDLGQSSSLSEKRSPRASCQQHSQHLEDSGFHP